MSIEYRGETFSGYNKPKNDRTKTKKFSVLAKSGDTIKLISTNAIPKRVY
jgi:hypothetical protein